MPPTQANGKICYIEFPAVDIRRSAEFYEKVFGWRIRKRGDVAIAFDDTVNEVSGAWVVGRKPATEPGLLMYIWVDSVAAAVEAVIAHGGKIVQPIGADAPEITARFTDPAGNVIGLYQEPTSASPLRADRWAWEQLANAASCRFGQDSVLWTISGSFWSTNAVLLVALFASGRLPEEQFVKTLVCASGLAVSLMWWIMQAAALRRVKWYEEVIKGLEKDLRIPEDRRLLFGQDPEAGPDDIRWPPQARKVMPFAPLLAIVSWAASLALMNWPALQKLIQLV